MPTRIQLGPGMAMLRQDELRRSKRSRHRRPYAIDLDEVIAADTRGTIDIKTPSDEELVTMLKDRADLMGNEASETSRRAAVVVRHCARTKADDERDAKEAEATRRSGLAPGSARLSSEDAKHFRAWVLRFAERQNTAKTREQAVAPALGAIIDDAVRRAANCTSQEAGESVAERLILRQTREVAAHITEVESIEVEQGVVPAPDAPDAKGRPGIVRDEFKDPMRFDCAACVALIEELAYSLVSPDDHAAPIASGRKKLVQLKRLHKTLKQQGRPDEAIDDVRRRIRFLEDFMRGKTPAGRHRYQRVDVKLHDMPERPTRAKARNEGAVFLARRALWWLQVRCNATGRSVQLVKAICFLVNASRPAGSTPVDLEAVGEWLRPRRKPRRQVRTG